MKIEIEEFEIKEAILAYVEAKGFSVDASKASVDLKAGRGTNGMSANISMDSASSEALIIETSDVEETKEEEVEVPPTTALKFGK